LAVNQTHDLEHRVQAVSAYRGSPELLEVLLLCEEALSVSLNSVACEGLKESVAALSHGGTLEQLGGLLERTTRALRPEIGPDGLRIFSAVAARLDGVSHSLAQDIRRFRLWLGGRRFVYHGTTLGRLESIERSGLRLGEPAVWGQDFLQAHRSSAVFFAESLGGAESWALCAFLRGRGRREAKNRRPVVIRLAADELELLPDTLAAAPGCLMTSQRIDVSYARCTFTGGGTLPDWQGLTELRSSKALPELPKLYKTA
jgi:hypothetical protein